MKRRRIMFRFWLDANKTDETEIGEFLEQCRFRRKMKPTILKALKLWISLLRGETDVLKELFPDVVQRLQAEQMSVVYGSLPATINGNGTTKNGNGRSVKMPATDGGNWLDDRPSV